MKKYFDFEDLNADTYVSFEALAGARVTLPKQLDRYINKQYLQRYKRANKALNRLERLEERLARQELRRERWQALIGRLRGLFRRFRRFRRKESEQTEFLDCGAKEQPVTSSDELGGGGAIITKEATQVPGNS